jgi:uncharacterized damage-inducible protein DinB
VNPSGDLVMLTRYKAWADGRMFAALDGVSDDELTAKRPTILGTLVCALNHSYAMDLVWRAHLENKEHGFKTRRPELFNDVTELGKAQLEIDDWYIDYAGSLDPAAGNSIVDFEFIGGGEGSMTRNEILLHVVTHSNYHRGHVTDMMCQIPVRPPVTDMPVFIRELR